MAGPTAPASSVEEPLALQRYVLGALVLVLVWGLAILGPLGPLFGVVFISEAIPLLAVAVLGWLAPRSEVARVFAVLLLYLLGALLAAYTFLLAAVTLGAGAEGADVPGTPLASLALVLLLLLLLPALLLYRSVRAVLGRWLPLAPGTFRHWLGLVALLWFTAMPLATLPWLGGRPPAQALYEQAGIEAPGAFEWHDLLGLGWTVALCLVAVGFPLARRLPTALARLGLTWPGWRRLAAGVVLSVLLVPVALGLDAVVGAAVELAGLELTSDAWTERLFGRAFGVHAALGFALTAGLGEELVWRGLVQPRYGLLPATLGFTALHGFQYGPDGLITVFVLGLVFGLVRRWSNTTVAAVVHGGYDLWGVLGLVNGWW